MKNFVITIVIVVFNVIGYCYNIKAEMDSSALENMARNIIEQKTYRNEYLYICREIKPEKFYCITVNAKDMTWKDDKNLGIFNEPVSCLKFCYEKFKNKNKNFNP